MIRSITLEWLTNRTYELYLSKVCCCWEPIFHLNGLVSITVCYWQSLKFTAACLIINFKCKNFYHYSRIRIRRQNLCLYELFLFIKLYWKILPRLIQFVFKWANRPGMYDLFYELILGFDHSQVEKICVESSHASFGCFPYQL